MNITDTKSKIENNCFVITFDEKYSILVSEEDLNLLHSKIEEIINGKEKTKFVWKRNHKTNRLELVPEE